MGTKRWRAFLRWELKIPLTKNPNAFFNRRPYVNQKKRFLNNRKRCSLYGLISLFSQWGSECVLRKNYNVFSEKSFWFSVCFSVEYQKTLYRGPEGFLWKNQWIFLRKSGLKKSAMPRGLFKKYKGFSSLCNPDNLLWLDKKAFSEKTRRVFWDWKSSTETQTKIPRRRAKTLLSK